MLDQNQIDTAIGQEVYGSDGDKIGTARQVYADDQTGRPEWVTVTTGLFGTKESFIPLADASLSGNGITVPYTKAFVKDAPNIDEDGHLSPEQERQLYDYYSRNDYNDRNGYDDRGDADSARTDDAVHRRSRRSRCRRP